MMRIKRAFWTGLLALLLAAPSLSHAQDILTVTTADRTESFTLEEILAMPQTTVVTKNDYVDETTIFQGPSLRSVLQEMDITQDAALEMTALNDFSSQVPAADAFEYDVILAVLLNGERMSVRDKGPIWVIYPMDDNPELHDEIYNDRLVWQLKSISVD
ncbi:molybdopterin-dependent oxidoreductase [Sulfitobacter sp. HNIBRBA3233]|uniref:molybdopterin-dependent oxidoreductase n=1 Tax=Sulfitobacter marinivivus TaxID=3158558 RepID=UPI0032DECD6B